MALETKRNNRQNISNNIKKDIQNVKACQKSLRNSIILIPVLLYQKLKQQCMKSWMHQTWIHDKQLLYS